MAMPMRRPLMLCLLGALAFPAGVRAADGVHWTFTGPTSVTFDWRGSESTVRYGLTSLYGSSVVAVTPSPLPPSSSGPYWEARISGLQNNTAYHYAIGAGSDHTFRTPPAPGAKDFILFAEGD